MRFAYLSTPFIAIVHDNPTETFEKLMDLIDEHELQKLVKQRLSDASTPIAVKNLTGAI